MRQLGLSVIVELGKRVLEVPNNQAVQIASQALIEVVQSGTVARQNLRQIC